MTRHAMARLAGLLYLATLPTAGFAYGYVAFMPKDDPTALLAALEAARQTLGVTVVVGALGFVIYLLMAALFHRLLAHAGKVLADLLVLFVTASVLLALAALAQRMELMALLDAGQATADEALLLLGREQSLIQLGTIFWGLWMMPLGWLSWRAGLVPKIIGLGLMAGGVGYLSGFVLPVLAVVPPPAIAGLLAVVALASEFAFVLWLIVRGTGKQADAVPARA